MAENRGQNRAMTEAAFFVSGCIDILGIAILVLLLLVRFVSGLAGDQSAAYPSLANAWVYVLVLFAVTGAAHVTFLVLGRRLFGEKYDKWASLPAFFALLRGRLRGMGWERPRQALSGCAAGNPA